MGQGSGSGRPGRFQTLSGVPLDILYTPADLRRVRVPEGPRDSRASIRSRAACGRTCTGAGTGRCASSPGFGTARDTNGRYKFLLSHGETGLSVAFDFPTLYGRDSDETISRGEVGKCGVAIASLADMETLFDGIPLADVSTSMTINGPARWSGRSTSPRPRSRACRARSCAARSRTTCSRSTSPRSRGCSRPSLRCGSSPTSWATRPSTCPSGTRSPSPATTSARRARPRRRNWRSP